MARWKARVAILAIAGTAAGVTLCSLRQPSVVDVVYEFPARFSGRFTVRFLSEAPRSGAVGGAGSRLVLGAGWWRVTSRVGWSGDGRRGFLVGGAGGAGGAAALRLPVPLVDALSLAGMREYFG